MEDLFDKYKGKKVASDAFGDIIKSGSGKRADRGSIEKGKNIFRVMPPHDKDGDSGKFMGNLYGSWLPVMVDEYVDGKATGKQKKSAKLVYSALRHGVDVLDFDLVDQYIKYADAKFKAQYPGGKENKDYNEAMLPIFGDFGKRVNGIRPKDNPFMYVVRIDNDTNDLGDKVVLLNLKTISVVKQLKEIQMLESGNSPLLPDIYSDVEVGIPFVVVYKPDADQASDIYKVSLHQPKQRNANGKQEVREYPVPVELLEQFESFPSLVDLYGPKSFKANDFKLQLDGLKMFDAENNYNFFKDDAKWQEMVSRFETEAERALGQATEYAPRQAEATSTPAPTSAPVKTKVEANALPFDEGTEEEEEETEALQPATAPAAGSRRSRWGA